MGFRRGRGNESIGEIRVETEEVMAYDKSTRDNRDSGRSRMK